MTNEYDFLSLNSARQTLVIAPTDDVTAATYEESKLILTVNDENGNSFYEYKMPIKVTILSSECVVEKITFEESTRTVKYEIGTG